MNVLFGNKLCTNISMELTTLDLCHSFCSITGTSLILSFSVMKKCFKCNALALKHVHDVGICMSSQCIQVLGIQLNFELKKWHVCPA